MELKPLVAFHVTVPSATEKAATLAVSERITRRTIPTTLRSVAALSPCIPPATASARALVSSVRWFGGLVMF
jgi:hypothetical protein